MQPAPERRERRERNDEDERDVVERIHLDSIRMERWRSACAHGPTHSVTQWVCAHACAHAHCAHASPR